MPDSGPNPSLAARISARVLDRIIDRFPVISSQLKLLGGASGARKKKPGELVHGVDDVPPPIVAFFLGTQHVGLIQMAALVPEASVNMLSLAMLALGIGTILQSLPFGPVGSRFLCPSCHSEI